MGLGTVPCSPKAHKACSQGSQCSTTIGTKLIPVCQACPVPTTESRATSKVPSPPAPQQTPIFQEGAWKKQLIPWEKQSWDHQSSMAGWHLGEYPSRWEVSSSPCPLVHPQKELATTEGFAPSTSNPNSIPLPASRATFPQLHQCYFESIEIMLEALIKRFVPAAFCPHLKMTIFL